MESSQETGNQSWNQRPVSTSFIRWFVFNISMIRNSTAIISPLFRFLWFLGVREDFKNLPWLYFCDQVFLSWRIWIVAKWGCGTHRMASQTCNMARAGELFLKQPSRSLFCNEKPPIGIHPPFLWHNDHNRENELKIASKAQNFTCSLKSSLDFIQNQQGSGFTHRCLKLWSKLVPGKPESSFTLNCFRQSLLRNRNYFSKSEKLP